ncbi:hypothetical protein MYRA21_2779 [Myroides sp. A21]|uniref:hypothetical protein n=1 Tax=Myroides sp. A21 TaxID=1583100 RepID=UPI0005860890|nr:hypothetical protein [Myroides sp. A21]AJA69888.1 hypothetical protein MYRA21_2779 [Myroides sp. A21]
MKIDKNEVFMFWLVDNNITSVESAESYDSYVRNAFLCMNVNVSRVKDINIVAEVIDVLSEKGIGQKMNKSPKTIQNYLSGLRAYGEFLNDTNELNTDVVNLATEKILEQITNSPQQVYTTDELHKNFMFRLITQDRFYEDIYFPISLIKQFFDKTNNKSTFDAIIKDMIDGIKIHHSEKEVILFKDISELKIKNDSVSIVSGNKNVVIYTPTNSEEFEPFCSDKLSEISIDHIVSQHTIIQELKHKIPEFIKLTDILKKAPKKVVSRPTLAAYKKEFGLEQLLQSVDLVQLEKEFRLIVSKTELQLMDRKLNTSKGKK